MSVLKADHISIQFGGLRAVDDFYLEMKAGELWAIIGPNGAGKTTVFNMLTGLYQPTEGEIFIDGHSTKGLKPHEFTAAGLARTFQNIRLFGKCSVLDNVKMAHTMKCGYGYMSMLLRDAKYRSEEKRITEASMALLELFELADKRDFFASNLPYGEQRKLEIVRALATGPKVLLLDEPAAGMNPNEIDDVIELIQKVHREMNQTILMIEHHMKLVMSIAQRIKVIDFGITIAEGTPDEVRNNPKVIAAYLGGNPDAHA
ncbi:MAG: ABC transporter ATP-binding protein [Clostridia bacterium]|nr:ABC transporter ATP-binding protein [Candidatus Pelethousia sp.]NCB31093.1 ABC transporter ATP-binding protein [Clostridia bacterium]